MGKGGASPMMVDAPPHDKGYFLPVILPALQREVGLAAR